MLFLAKTMGVILLGIAVLVVSVLLQLRLSRRRDRLRKEAMKPIPLFPADFTDWEELQLHLDSRIHHHRMISPDLVLCQLQFGTIDRDCLIRFILEFEIDSVNKAILALEELGLR